LAISVALGTKLSSLNDHICTPMTKRKKHLKHYSKREVTRSASIIGSLGGRKKAARLRRKRKR